MSFGTEGKRRGGGSACGRTARVLVAGLVGALVGGTPSVAANEFPINACQADRINYSTQAFEDFATRGMLWRRACNPEGPGLRGLVTANVVRPGRIKRGARSLFVLRAPPGTHFTTFVWSGSAVRTDCRYALQLWAYGPDGPTAAIKNVRANHRCTPAESKTQIAGWPSPRAYDVRGATSIVQRVVCMGDKGEPYCSSRARNYLRTFTAQALVADVTPPAVSIVPNNPFTRGAWVSGAQSVAYERVGQCWGEGSASRGLVATFRGEHPRGCNFAQRVPCSNGVGRHPRGHESAFGRLPGPIRSGLRCRRQRGHLGTGNGARRQHRSGCRTGRGRGGRGLAKPEQLRPHMGQPQRR